MTSMSAATTSSIETDSPFMSLDAWSIIQNTPNRSSTDEPISTRSSTFYTKRKSESYLQTQTPSSQSRTIVESFQKSAVRAIIQAIENQRNMHKTLTIFQSPWITIRWSIQITYGLKISLCLLLEKHVVQKSTESDNIETFLNGFVPLENNANMSWGKIPVSIFHILRNSPGLILDLPFLYYPGEEDYNIRTWSYHHKYTHNFIKTVGQKWVDFAEYVKCPPSEIMAVILSKSQMIDTLPNQTMLNFECLLKIPSNDKLSLRNRVDDLSQSDLYNVWRQSNDQTILCLDITGQASVQVCASSTYIDAWVHFYDFEDFQHKISQSHLRHVILWMQEAGLGANNPDIKFLSIEMEKLFFNSQQSRQSLSSGVMKGDDSTYHTMKWSWNISKSCLHTWIARTAVALMGGKINFVACDRNKVMSKFKQERIAWQNACNINFA